MESKTIRAIDNYMGYESEGDFLNLDALRSVYDAQDIADVIDRYTEYYVDSVSQPRADVGYGRYEKLNEAIFQLVHKSTTDDTWNDDVNRLTLKVGENTKWRDILQKTGYAFS